MERMSVDEARRRYCPPDAELCPVCRHPLAKHEFACMPGGHVGAYEADQRQQEVERTAFIEAITKLADDPEFRRSFLTHYNMWLHPPLMVEPPIDLSKFDFRPGAINWVTPEEQEALAGYKFMPVYIQERQRDGACAGDPRGEPGVLK